MMQKKEASLTLREKLVRAITFWGAKIKKISFTKSGQFLLLLKKIKISATPDPPNRRWGAIFSNKSLENVVFLRLKVSVFPGRSPGNST